MHRLVEDRPLVLGGIRIPFAKGLLGHSDADVLLHAVADACLGALALGDIGQWFPDTSPQYRGADSAILLETVLGSSKFAGWRLGNLDCTIMAQRPKLAGYIPAMRGRLAAIFQAEPDQISVKATTTEKLGFVGREEGIAASAVVLLTRIG